SLFILLYTHCSVAPRGLAGSSYPANRRSMSSCANSISLSTTLLPRCGCVGPVGCDAQTIPPGAPPPRAATGGGSTLLPARPSSQLNDKPTGRQNLFRAISIGTPSSFLMCPYRHRTCSASNHLSSSVSAEEGDNKYRCITSARALSGESQVDVGCA